MRITTVNRVTVASLGFIVALAVPRGLAVGATITYLDQVRSVSADANVHDFSGTADHQTNSQQATGFDPFNGFITESALVGASGVGPTTTAIGDQQSTLGPSGMALKGYVQADSTFHADGSGTAVAESLFAVDFSIAQTSDFVLSLDLNSAPDLNVPGNSSISIELKDAKGKAVAGPVQNLNLSNSQRSRTLPAGKYSLVVTAQAKSNDESFNFINYDIGLSTTSGIVAPPVSAVPEAVPLPPAVFPAGALLLGLGLTSRVRRRSL